MKPAPFEYKAPDSLEEALTNLRDHAEDAKLLAGGQSLVPTMNFRVAQPSILIDLNRVQELQFIHQADQGTLHIGAMTRERLLEIDPRIAKAAPLLAEAMPHVAHPQIRNRGTLGGSLANADPAAELPVIMLALGARLKACNTSSERWLDASDFFTGMFTTALAPDEILVEIEIPPLLERTGWSFMEVAPRAGDYALMGVAALVVLGENERCQRARLVYLNAGDGPIDAMEAVKAMEGEIINENVIEAAAELASQKEINPFGNVHASPDFQRHLARVLTSRALKKAIERTKQDRLQ
jgi:carbon-monoxide dehydrogenase medium subunit